MSALESGAAVGTAELYFQVQQFYAEQMHLLDAGEVEAWAGTFTPDGIFAANAQPEPVVGREAIAAAARKVVDDYAERRVQRRHWLGMVSVRQEAGQIAARCYALVLETPFGGATVVRVSTTCDDTLEASAGGWLVRERRISRDDL